MRSLSEFIINLSWGLFMAPHFVFSIIDTVENMIELQWTSQHARVVAQGNLFSDISAS